jgi:hypothetical protein
MNSKEFFLFLLRKHFITKKNLKKNLGALPVLHLASTTTTRNSPFASIKSTQKRFWVDLSF